MTQYYDEKEKLTGEYIRKIFFLSKNSELKNEKREFFLNHRYVFSFFTDREKELINYYYGIDSGNVDITLDTMSQMYGCSIERNRQLIARAINRLEKDDVFNILCKYTDDDILIYSTDGQLTKEQILTISKELQTKRNLDSFQSLSEEDRELNIYLDMVLNKRINKIPQLNEIILDPEIWKYIKDCNTVGDLLSALDLESLGNYKLKEVIYFFHSKGILFNCEEEYYGDWRTECIEGIKKFGVDEFRKIFKLANLNNLKYDNLLDKEIYCLHPTPSMIAGLKARNINTIGDLISLREIDLYDIKRFGLMSIVKIIEKVYSLGLNFCPIGVEPNEWITKLKAIAQKQISSKDEIIESAKNAELQILLESSIDKMNLSNRARNCLYRAGIDNIKKLINTSGKELLSIRYLGTNVLYEIQGALSLLGLSLSEYGCEDGENKDEIQDESQNKYDEKVNLSNGSFNKYNQQSNRQNKSNQDAEVTQDIKNNPYYVMGVGYSIQNDLKTSSPYEILITRALNKRKKRIPEANEINDFPKVTYDYKQPKDLEERLFDIVKDNVIAIYNLEESFIRKNKDLLRRMVYETEEISVEDKADLMYFISNPNYFSLSN